MSIPKSILLIEPSHATQVAVVKSMTEFKVDIAVAADEAITMAADNMPDAVVIELSLAGHSGLEFLYEFRTYSDWVKIPVIVFTSVRLKDEVLKSKSWQQLGITEYLYKPGASISDLKAAVQGCTGGD